MRLEIGRGGDPGTTFPKPASQRARGHEILLVVKSTPNPAHTRRAKVRLVESNYIGVTAIRLDGDSTRNIGFCRELKVPNTDTAG